MSPLPSDTACAQDIAFDFNTSGHFAQDTHSVALSYVQFFTPDSSIRTRCGGIQFGDSGSDTSYVKVTQKFMHLNDWQVWQRRLRGATTGAFSDANLHISKRTDTSSTQVFYFRAPARDDYDLLGFAHHYAHDSAGALASNAEVNGKAQVWKAIDRPTSIAVEGVGFLIVRVKWQNHHRGRSIDSTQVWRRTAGVWNWLATRSFSLDSLRDTLTASGQYWYAVRHVTALFTYPPGVDDIGDLSQPNSGFTDSLSYSLGLVPPNGLVCEGNFSATIDCRWLDSIPAPTASFQIWRGHPTPNQVGTTASASVHNWTDTATRGHTYGYKGRRVQTGDSSNFGPTYTVVAAPLPPYGLSCGGTTSQTVVCVWVNTETESGTSVRVERCQAIDVEDCEGQWAELGYVTAATTNSYTDENSGLKNNLTYWYQVRYLNGGEYTGYSNPDDAHPGSHEPYGPGGP